MKEKLVICLLLFVGASCNKDSEVPHSSYYYDQRDQFVGTYRIEHDSGYEYTMKVIKVDSLNRRYLLVTNFANLFDSLWSNNYQQNIYNLPLNRFLLGWHFGVKDYYGRTWDVGGGYDDTSTSEMENMLKGKKMVLYYRLQNMPWWGVDSVPYHFGFHKHFATKLN